MHRLPIRVDAPQEPIISWSSGLKVNVHVEWLQNNFPQAYAGFLAELMQRGTSRYNTLGYEDFDVYSSNAYKEMLDKRESKYNSKVKGV